MIVFVVLFIVLVCGGVGYLFLSMMNFVVSMGDGIVMATRAGVAVVNMEFM